jgi:ubiquinone/menaquinone biosynthesis C-methylase UbiE
LTLSNQTGVVAAERGRILAEYNRRGQEIPADFYAPWQPASIFIASERKRIAATMMHKAGVFPSNATRCLEVGYGSLGWLGDLISWGVRDTNIHGIELNPLRAKHAQELLPMSDLRVGDAAKLPWPDNTFQLVIASTIFTSILDPEVRGAIAGEIARVLSPKGALLWYDFRVNNPRNPHVRKVNRRELRSLFPLL